MATLGILKYKKYKELRKNLGTTGKWYAKAVQDRMVDFEDFVTHISEHNTPYSRGVIHGVLIDMLSCLQELVLDGKSVRLGELGLFSIGMTTKPADTAEQFTAQNITGVHLNVRNTKTWSNAELRKKCRLQELSSYSVTESVVEGGNPAGDGHPNGNDPQGMGGGNPGGGNPGGGNPGGSSTGGSGLNPGGSHNGQPTDDGKQTGGSKPIEGGQPGGSKPAEGGHSGGSGHAGGVTPDPTL